jgi:hypothetical protein
MENDFYITLPSHKSDLYKDNKLSKFSTRLYKEIDVQDYLVGLSEIHIDCSNKGAIHDDSSDYSFKITIRNVENSEVIFNLPNKKYRTLPVIIRRLNAALKSNDSTMQFFFRSVTKFEIQELQFGIVRDRGLINKKKLPEKSDILFTFSDDLATLLGLPYNELTGDNFGIIRPGEFFKNQIPNLMFLYTNICEPNIVGDTSAPLLRIIRIKNKNSSSAVCKSIIYDNIHYVPVLINSISTINIALRAMDGSLFPLHNGSVTIKLHFKRL